MNVLNCGVVVPEVGITSAVMSWGAQEGNLPTLHRNTLAWKLKMFAKIRYCGEFPFMKMFVFVYN